MTTYNTNLAAEFYVLSMLYRLGVDASLTLGNKKAVDIIVTSDRKAMKTIDVKGLAGPYDWPADNIHELEDPEHFYALLSFENKITKPDFAPPVWIIPANQLKPFIHIFTTRKVVSRAEIKAKGLCFKNAWHLITGNPPAIPAVGDVTG